MATLRSLLSSLEPPSIGNAIQMFYVGNMAATGYTSGGATCDWTVPANITSVTFEGYGAGGDGGGGCCCHNTAMGAVGGTYAIKTLDVVAGNSYRICAPRSGCCHCNAGVGNNGAPAWASCIATGAVFMCACGGSGANMQPTWTGSGNGYTCCWGRIGTSGTGDLVLPGVGGTGIRNTYCHTMMYQIVAGGQFSGGKTSPDMCSIWPCQGCAIMKSYAQYPGGAGADGNTCGGPKCYGQWGQAGMVKITYK
jgi:hypothetical protein